MTSDQSLAIRIRVSVLIRQAERVCLVRHVKDGRVYWLLPGGGQEPLETVEDAVRRELLEETGIRISSVSFLFARETMNAEAGRHILFLVFAGHHPDFSHLTASTDPRVTGIDFFLPSELDHLSMYPNIGQDLRRLLLGENIPLFGSPAWIP